MADGDELDVAGWNAANPLHPRAGDGKFTDRLSGALRSLAEAFGEVIQYEEFGEPDHDRNSHGVMALHDNGMITIASIDEEGGHGVIVRGGPHEPWGELADSLNSAASDAASSDEILSEDYSEEFGHQLDVSFGTYGDGDAFVGLDSEEYGLALDPESAEVFVGQLEILRELQESHVSGDPTATRALAPGEHMERRKTFPEEYGGGNQAVAGLISTPEGSRIRLGVISSEADEARKWTGGRGKTTLDLDRESAGEIAEVLEEFDRNGRERQKIHDRIDAKYAAMEDEGEEVNWEEAAAEEVAETGGTWEDDFDDATIETAWGTIRLTDVGMDDEANGHRRHVRVEIWPTGMTAEQYDAGQEPTGGPGWAWPGSKSRYEKPQADLNAKAIKALIKLLRGSFETAPITKSARGAASKIDRDRIAREGRKYWTRSAEGLGKWARKAHPWTALYRHLSTKMNPELARRLTSSYFKAVFGYAPSARQGKNPVGKG